MNGKSVYILESIMPNQDRHDINKYEFADKNCGSVSCRRIRIGVYDDVKLAEADIQTLVKEQEDFNLRYDDWLIHFGFVLTEVYLNSALRDNGDILYFASVRSYDCNGDLICLSDYDSDCEKKFIGREVPVKGVKPGEFCLYLSGNEVIPIYLDTCAISKEEWAKRFEAGVQGDFTDDSGLGFDVSTGHMHPASCDVFPMYCLPRYVLDDEVKDKCLARRMEYYDDSVI